MGTLLKSILQKITYVIAACIIIAALLISIGRLVTPILDDHRADFENWASQLLEMPVHINQVRATWYQYHPEITLNQVTILNKKTKLPILQIQKVGVFISLLKSIWQLKPVPNGILISGVDVNIHENQNGDFSVQGFPVLGGFNNQPYQSETKFTDILAWLSVQPTMILQDIELRYTPHTGEKRYVTFYHLSLENVSEKHVLLGKAILHQDIPTEINFGIQWKGKEITLDKIKAKVYLYISGLSLPQWLANFKWNGWQVNQGLLSAKIWATWNQGEFQKIQSQFQAYGLNLFPKMISRNIL